MREQQVQAKLIKKYEEEGNYVIKLTKTNKNGIPDLIIIPPGSNVTFIEVKAKNGKTSKLQEYRHKELKDKGLTVIVHKE